MELEKVISKFLRVGVILCFSLLVLSLIPTILSLKGNLSFYKDYDPIPLTESLIFFLAQKNWSMLCAYTALCVLILLPFFRLLIMGFGLAKKKELLMSSLSFFVFFLLILSSYLGF